MTKQQIQQKMCVKIKGCLFPVESYKDASDKFATTRDRIWEQGGTSDDIPRVDLVIDGKVVGYISQNAKVWLGRRNWSQPYVSWIQTLGGKSDRTKTLRA